MMKLNIINQEMHAVFQFWMF